MALPELSAHNRRTTFGREFFWLKSIYPIWSDDLHKRGNILSNSKLAIMAKYGIIKWYMDNESPYDIHYPYIEYINNFIDNPRKIQWYDFLQLLKVAKHHKIHLSITDKYNFQGIKKSYQKFLDDHFQTYNSKSVITTDNTNYYKYIKQPFSYFLLENVRYANLIDFLQKILYHIEKRNYWFTNRCIFDTFLADYPQIIKWGIIYQKFKVILEKMSYMKHKDIYKIDSFVDKVQKCIYSLVFHYMNTLINNDSKYIFIDDDITGILENRRLLELYPESQFKFDFLF